MIDVIRNRMRWRKERAAAAIKVSDYLDRKDLLAFMDELICVIEYYEGLVDLLEAERNGYTVELNLKGIFNEE